jgi:exoribonuclease R
MPGRPVRLVEVSLSFDALREELGIPGAFGPEALAEAARPPRELPREDARDVPFVTIDPPGSRDLDQALHLERRPGGGYRVRYAIADVAAFVAPGGALDREAWARGVTAYAPDGRSPLHPPAMSEGAASLLAEQDRPALLWTIDLDAEGARVAAGVRRARVRSRAQLDYDGVQALLDGGGAPEPLVLLAEVGRLREARERARGGVSLPVPEQEVHPARAGAGGGGWALAYRAPVPVEGYNAQISLLTGLAAADLMLEAGVGLLRTVPPPEDRAVARLRRTAAALGSPWAEARPYPDFVRSLDPGAPAHAAILREATRLMRGAGYAAFDGAPPEQARHAAIAEEYAHVTAPLRRLADRHALEACLAAAAGEEPPAWVREALPRLPEAMAAAGRRASALERAVVDLVEATVLADRVGEEFRGVVVEAGEDGGTIQIAEPAVRGRVEGASLPVGEEIAVRLAEADPVRRVVAFTPVPRAARAAT